MLIFYEGKGLPTVFNETTVGEQNPFAALGGPSSLFRLRKVHLSPSGRGGNLTCFRQVPADVLESCAFMRSNAD